MLDVTPTSCNYCKSKTPEKIIADKLIRDLPENEIFNGKLKIVQCLSCGLRYLNPRPAPHSLPAIYDFDVYSDSTNSNEVLQKYFLNLASKHHESINNVIEIGCGTGEFLAFLEKKEIKVTGVEFADSSHRVKFKGKLYVGRIEDINIPAKRYDVVYLLNVIEHLSDPQQVLIKIHDCLKDDGLLIMRHPNSDLFFNGFYKFLIEYPKYIVHRLLKRLKSKTKFTIVGFQNQHLFYFDAASVKNILTKCNFDTLFITTEDPFNRYRAIKSFKELRFTEGFIASLRHTMSLFHKGPECIVVANPKKP